LNPDNQTESNQNEQDNEVPHINKRPFLFDLPHMIYRRFYSSIAARRGNLSGIPINFSWITPNLAVGGRYPVEAIEHLATRFGITHIVDVRVEEKDNEAVLREHGITLLHLPTIDSRAVSQEMLEDGVAWVNQQLADGGKVYIHCAHGIGRSVLLACCVLVSMGYSAQDALRQVKQKRPQAAPNQEQLNALVEFARRWRKQFGGFSGDTLTDLKAIAYSDRATLGLERRDKLGLSDTDKAYFYLKTWR
jgi:protein-tyrosine phosphatase